MGTAAARLHSLILRRQRLEVISKRVMPTAKLFDDEFPSLPTQVTLRRGYAFKSTPAGGSSRMAPARADRPPATRLVSSRGCALRLHLTMIAVVQATCAPGKEPRRTLPLDGRKGVGWAQLLVTGSEDQRTGEYYLTYKDKKIRSAQAALGQLRRSGLVHLPRFSERRDRYDGARLWDEEGVSAAGLDPVEYRVPIPHAEPSFTVPAALFRRGWLHVLEDSELAVLLMLSCGFRRIGGETTIAIPGDVRTGNYGLSQAAYSSYSILADLGLLAYDGMTRNSDGTVVDFDGEPPTLTRFTLLPEGFKENPVRKLGAVLDARLAAS